MIKIIIVAIMSAGSASAQSVHDFLIEFHRDPQTAYRRLPPEVNERGEVIPRGFVEDGVDNALDARHEIRLRFLESDANIESLQTFDVRDRTGPDDTRLRRERRDRHPPRRERGPVREQPREPRSETPNPLVEAQSFVEPGARLVDKLQQMENRGFLNVTVTPIPWSGSYWPFYKGMTGARYADPRFPDSRNWATNYQYIVAHPASLNSGDPDFINSLSPAEKYDLAVGDSDMTLTKFAWQAGRGALEKYGVVASWLGICHGWSGAAHMGAKYPNQPVTVTAPGGTEITFYPDDVQALQSMLWANAPLPTRMLGTRCYQTRPPATGAGRILSPSCFDIDPAAWHLAIINQLAVQRRSVVVDTTYDAEVWNFAVPKISYTYFNPQTLRQYDSVKPALVRIRDFWRDKFSSYRAPGAQYVVGIVMDVSYARAITPTVRLPTTPPDLKTIRYMYDLEVDDDGNLVGGEWYNLAHPDFMWTFAAGAQATAPSEKPLLEETWSPTSEFPSEWLPAAHDASTKGIPLFSFIRALTR